MFEQNIYRMVDQNNGKEIKQVLDTENNKVIWERAIPTYDTPIVPTRNAPLLEVSVDGVCTQEGTPTPDNYVPIMCNNGEIKYGWHDIITTSQLSGYGTYVSPTSTTGNRAYKWLKDLPNGTYNFAVDGDYEIIVQWRDPADPSVLIPSAYENLTGWMTSGEVVLDKESGGYGIAVRRPSGASITPSDFDGVLHVQERGLYIDGTPEVLTISTISSIQSENIIDAKGLDSRTGIVVSNAARCYTMLGYYPVGTTIVQRARDNKLGSYLYMYNNDTPSTESFIETANMSTAIEVDGWYERSATSTSDGYLFIQSLTNKTDSLSINWSATQPLQTVSVPNLFAVGNYADKVEIIVGGLKRHIGWHIFDGTETFSTSTAYGKAFLINASYITSWGADRTKAVLCTHFLGLPQTSGSQPDNTCFFNATGHFYFRVADNSDTEAFKTWLAEQYAAGTPVIAPYVLAEEITESITSQDIQGYKGKIMTVTAQSQYVSGQNIKVKYLGIDSGAISGEMEVPGGDLP